MAIAKGGVAYDHRRSGTQDIVALARASIAEHFAQEPKRVVVRFAVPGAARRIGCAGPSET